MSTHRLRIAITGGGTGRHILPLVSLLQTIDSEQRYWTQLDNIYWFGQKGAMEYKFYSRSLPQFVHICPQFISIRAGKYRRETLLRSRLKNIRDIVFVLPRGILQSLYHLITKRIDIVFCKGGFVALPVVIAAWIARRTIYVHDSDTTPGLTTRLASRFASQNFSGFPDILNNSLTVGQILSDDLVKIPQQSDFTFPNDKILILVAGGSLGSQKLYQAVLKATMTDPRFVENTIIFFVNGKHVIKESDLPVSRHHIVISDLITDQATMGYLYRRADIAVVRGGTTTLAEAKIFQTPLIIVPLPITHDQQRNAEYYRDRYHDTLLHQEDPDFVQQLYQSLASTTSKHITISDQKIKTKILKAKHSILDKMFGLSSSHEFSDSL